MHFSFKHQNQGWIVCSLSFGQEVPAIGVLSANEPPLLGPLSKKQKSNVIIFAKTTNFTSNSVKSPLLS